MSNVSLKPAAVVFPQSDIEHLKGRKTNTLEAEKERLHKATEEFESFFTYYMLKTMRKTIPKNSLTSQAPLSGGTGKDIFTDLFDMELARNISQGKGQSISDLLYNSMEKLVDAEFGQTKDTKDKIEVNPLNKAADPFDLNRDIYHTLPSSIQMPELRSDAVRIQPVVSPERISAVNTILTRYGRHIEEAARQTSLDPTLIASVIRAESNGNPQAVSKAGAKGLMQLMDSTAEQYKVEQVFEPRENIHAGAHYLKDLMDRFGDMRLALAAYNAGPTNVVRHNGVPPFKETQEYIDNVIDTLNTMRQQEFHGETKEQ
ncbi:MAG: transglycosylase SLT domain-containing protein [candidate division Zixibacteria bacterium]|nr:transglycosylase SLT domain-containing protein [candidate division Zixibacteria bacterium]